MIAAEQSSRVLRFEVPVDDLVHVVPEGLVLQVTPYRAATRNPAGRLEVWVEVLTPEGWPEVREIGVPRRVQAFGTGHHIPDGAVWRGSCLDGQLVWHLYDLGPALGGGQE